MQSSPEPDENFWTARQPREDDKQAIVFDVTPIPPMGAANEVKLEVRHEKLGIARQAQEDDDKQAIVSDGTPTQRMRAASEGGW